MAGNSRKRASSPDPGPAQSPKKTVSFHMGSGIRQGPSGTGDVNTRTRSPKNASLQSGSSQKTLATKSYEVRLSRENLEKMDMKEVRRRAHEMLNAIYNNPCRPKNGEQSYQAIRKKFEQEQTKAGLRAAVFDLNVEKETWEGKQRSLSREAPPPVSPNAPRKALASAMTAPVHLLKKNEMAQVPAALTHPLKKVEMTSASKLLAEDVLHNDDWEDREICDRIASLVDDVREFSLAFRDMKIAENFYASLLAKENKQLIYYLGCLATAGKDGEISWEELLTDSSTRPALVMGIVGRALKEHVFSDLWFGSSTEEKKELVNMEEKNVEITDGFSRTKERAERVQQFAKKAEKSTLEFACAKIVLQLEKMLTPFWDGRATRLDRHARRQLHAIVTDAANLSRDMRQKPDVIYYWPPTFKDEEFEPSRMECLNLTRMMSESPYEKKKIGNFERAVLQEGNEYRNEAIIRVVCFPGIVAYRQGGGRLAQEELTQEKKRLGNAPPDVAVARRRMVRHGTDSFTGQEGFRSRIICKSVVWLAWDQQRLLTKEAGISAHIDAQKVGGSMQKYRDDCKGFVELFDVVRKRWSKA